ncbi:MAG: hypothetical protein V1859_05540 [archaeon]
MGLLGKIVNIVDFRRKHAKLSIDSATGKFVFDGPPGHYRFTLQSDTFALAGVKQQGIIHRFLRDWSGKNKQYVDLYLNKAQKVNLDVHVKSQKDNPDIPDNLKYCTLVGHVFPYCNPNPIDIKNLSLPDLNNPNLRVWPIMHPGIRVQLIRLSPNVEFDKNNWDESFGKKKTFFGRHQIYDLPISGTGAYMAVLPKGKYKVKLYLEKNFRKKYLDPSPKEMDLPATDKSTFIKDIRFSVNERPASFFLRRVIGGEGAKKGFEWAYTPIRDLCRKLGDKIYNWKPWTGVLNGVASAIAAIPMTPRPVVPGAPPLPPLPPPGLPPFIGILAGVGGPALTQVANTLGGILDFPNKIIGGVVKVGAPIVGAVAGVQAGTLYGGYKFINPQFNYYKNKAHTAAGVAYPGVNAPNQPPP